MTARTPLEQFWSEKWKAGPENLPWRGEESDKVFISSLESIMHLHGTTYRAFIPLCGNTPVLRLLWNSGYEVTGVDLVAEAHDSTMQQLFPNLSFLREEVPDGTLYRAERIWLYQKDLFDCHFASEFSLVYDRAALIAVEPSTREKYAELLGESLAPGGVMYIESLDTPGVDAAEAPFPIPAPEVTRLFSRLETVSQETVEVFRGIKNLVERGATRVLKTTTILRASSDAMHQDKRNSFG